MGFHCYTYACFMNSSIILLVSALPPLAIQPVDAGFSGRVEPGVSEQPEIKTINIFLKC